ncbi:hypothetical protein H1C71_006945 [Ictidomys tridecemlineatus]|nr:hypothetical protein H1C71_006945 [Ictidomys tridecemlineatus]
MPVRLNAPRSLAPGKAEAQQVPVEPASALGRSCGESPRAGSSEAPGRATVASLMGRRPQTKGTALGADNHRPCCLLLGSCVREVVGRSFILKSCARFTTSLHTRISLPLTNSCIHPGLTINGATNWPPEEA